MGVPCPTRVSSSFSSLLSTSVPPRSDSDADALKGRDHFLAEQANRIGNHFGRHAADLVIGAEHVISNCALALAQTLDHRLRTADQGQALLDIEFVALAGHGHGLAAQLVVRQVAVTAHATNVASPAD